MRYRIEWIPPREAVWEDTFQGTDNLSHAMLIAKRWKQGLFCYEKPEDARVVDTVENKVIEVEEN